MKNFIRIVSLAKKSAYRNLFSTETALVKVTNDLFLNLDRTKSTFYIRLDLSTAFDTLNHELLLSILEIILGFKSKKLSFLNSYLSSRSQKVLIDGEYSMPRTIKTGVTQIYSRSRSFFMLSCSSGSSVWTSWCQLSILCRWHCYLFCLPFFYKWGGFWFDTYDSEKVVQWC